MWKPLSVVYRQCAVGWNWVRPLGMQSVLKECPNIYCFCIEIGFFFVAGERHWIQGFRCLFINLNVISRSSIQANEWMISLSLYVSVVLKHIRSDITFCNWGWNEASNRFFREGCSGLLNKWTWILTTEKTSYLQFQWISSIGKGHGIRKIY